MIAGAIGGCSSLSSSLNVTRLSGHGCGLVCGVFQGGGQWHFNWSLRSQESSLLPSLKFEAPRQQETPRAPICALYNLFDLNTRLLRPSVFSTPYLAALGSGFPFGDSPSLPPPNPSARLNLSLPRAELAPFLPASFLCRAPRGRRLDTLAR